MHLFLLIFAKILNFQLFTPGTTAAWNNVILSGLITHDRVSQKIILLSVGLVWFSCVLWHINPGGLFDAKSYLYNGVIVIVVEYEHRDTNSNSE